MKRIPFILTNFKRPIYLKKLVTSLIEMGISDIHIIDNGSNIRDDVFLIKNTKIIKKEKNTGGSAGMHFLFCNLIKNDHEDQFNLILDDDLMLDSDYKKNFYLIINFISTFQKKFMLLSRRVNRSEWENQINFGHMNFDIPNSIFNWFLLKSMFYKMIKKKPTNYELGRVSLCECDKGHFGGMIIPTNLVSEITKPSSELYLYADDHRFVRINKKYNNIPLYQTSILKIFDQDIIDKPKENKIYNLNSAFDPNTDTQNLKYQIRNHFFESLKLKNKNSVFKINLILWFIINSWDCLIKTKNIFFVIRRISFIIKCLKDGKKLKMLIRD